MLTGVMSLREAYALVSELAKDLSSHLYASMADRVLPLSHGCVQVRRGIFGELTHQRVSLPEAHHASEHVRHPPIEPMQPVVRDSGVVLLDDVEKL